MHDRCGILIEKRFARALIKTLIIKDNVEFYSKNFPIKINATFKGRFVGR